MIVDSDESYGRSVQVYQTRKATMTRPTDAVHIPALTDDGGIFLSQEQRLEIAALLRVLKVELGRCYPYAPYVRRPIKSTVLIDCARAMAERMEPTPTQFHPGQLWLDSKGQFWDIMLGNDQDRVETRQRGSTVSVWRPNTPPPGWSRLS